MSEKMKFGVYGSASGELDSRAVERATEVGQLLAERGHTVITGATKGVTHEAVKAAHGAGGEVIGFSPAVSRNEHTELGLPVEEFTEIRFVPESYELVNEVRACRKYRNISSTNAVDAGIIISGQYGTLNEFTLLYDLLKPIGVLTETGGMADLLEGVTGQVVKEPHPFIVFNGSPEELVDQLESVL